jgi:3-methyladenine DNA glycosylase AlkD
MDSPDRKVLKLLRQEIKAHDKPENRHNYQRFFKEKLANPEGLRAPVLRKISGRCFKTIKDLPAPDILVIGDRLLATGERYMKFFAFEWALKVKKHFRAKDFSQFESWLKKYVDNWGACDHLCCGPIGHLVDQYPQVVRKTDKWARSKNRWLRRASAVSLIVPVRNEHLLDEVFGRAETLLSDSDDMVQKGYGWMLKEASNRFPDEVFQFVYARRGDMPRTALRYAVEKMPPAKRRKAMT